MFLLLGTQLNANTIIALSNYGEVRLLDSLKKTTVILDTFSFTKNDDVRLRFSEFLNPECTLVKYYIHQKRHSFFGSINEVNLFVYDIRKKQFLLHQVFDIGKTISNDSFVYSSIKHLMMNNEKFQEKYRITEYALKFSSDCTPLINGYTYAISGRNIVKKAYSINNMGDLRKSTVVVEMPFYEKSIKFLKYGYDDLTYDRSGEQLIFVFWNLVKTNSKKVSDKCCDVRSYNLKDSTVSIILDNACNPSVTEDGKYILFEKKNKQNGSHKVKSEGFFAKEIVGSEHTFIGYYYDVEFVKNFRSR